MGAMDDQSPPWLTKEFVQEKLREEDVECGQVDSIIVRKAVAANENYLSDLYRVTATIKQPNTAPTAQTRNIIIKSHLASEIGRQMATDIGAFDREVRMYQDTLPRLERLLARACVAMPREQRRLAPTVLSSDKDDEIIVMEDLCSKGYRIGDRRDGLDLPHALLVVRALGRLHGASLVLHTRDPAHLEYYGPYVSEQKKNPFKSVIQSNMKILVTLAKQWPELGEDVSQRLKILLDKSYDKLEKTFERKSGDLDRVLNHGDAWTNNIMFRYDYETAQVQSVRFVDFQMSSWDTPALDLIYFLELAVRPQVREAESNRILRAYYESLKDTMDVLGHGDKAPSFPALQRELLRRDFFRVIIVLCFLPLMLVEHDAAAKELSSVEKYLDLDGDGGDDSAKVHVLSNPVFRKRVAARIPEWIKKGHF